ncbi:MAG: hypothetical protein ACWGOX_01650, partial [Desulforhopalus sp.]
MAIHSSVSLPAGIAVKRLLAAGRSCSYPLSRPLGHCRSSIVWQHKNSKITVHIIDIDKNSN